MKLDKPSQCSVCATGDPHTILHQIRRDGTYRRLCTNCVLLTSHGRFCPFCFTLYSPHPPLPPHRATCLTCPSVAHLSCASSPGIFRCPSCLDSGFRYFRGWKKSDGAVDEGSGRALVCAAMVAAESLRRAAVAARVEAERKIKEAVLAKKRAKEALERVAVLVRMREVAEAEKDSVIDDDAVPVGVRFGGTKRKSAEGMSKNGVSSRSSSKKMRLENGNNGA